MGDTVVRKHFTDAKQDSEKLECYRLNKIFLRMIGQWPFSPLWQRRLVTTIFLCGMGNVYVLEIVYLVKNRINFDQMIDCFAATMLISAALIKFINIATGAESVNKIFVQMHHDWNANNGAAERRILQQYTDNSKFFTITYMVYMYSTMLVYIGLPTIPVILNYLIIRNESRQKILPSHVEYFIDQPTEHYWPCYFHQSFASFCVVTIVVACDTTYVTFVQYICGIFSSLKFIQSFIVSYSVRVTYFKIFGTYWAYIESYKLNHLTGEGKDEEDFYASKFDSKGFSKLADCIDHHQKAIRLADEVEDTYCISNLMLMMTMILTISITGVQTVIHIGNMDTVVFRCGANCIGLLIHMFFISLPGQALYDHSSSIFHAAYNCKWYSMCKKSRDLLRFIALRSLTPCRITAGKFFVMDLQRFSLVVKTAMSYCMVLVSMR